MNREIKQGDRVAYSREWLRNTGQMCGDIPQAKGTVKAVESFGDYFQVAIVNWDQPHLPQKINVKNLVPITKDGVIQDH